MGSKNGIGRKGGRGGKTMTYSGMAAYYGISFQFLKTFASALRKGFDQRAIHNSR